MNTAILKVVDAIRECNLHIERLSSAVRDLKTIFPLDNNKYDSLTEIDIRTLDQFIFRYSKLQDAMGERLFPSVLMILEENIAKMPFLDKLNRLEQLQLIESKDTWLYLRKLRNEFSHEYSNSTDENISAMNRLFDKLPDIYNIFMNIKNYLFEKFEEEFKQYNNELDTTRLF